MTQNIFYKLQVGTAKKIFHAFPGIIITQRIRRTRSQPF